MGNQQCFNQRLVDFIDRGEKRGCDPWGVLREVVRLDDQGCLPKVPGEKIINHLKAVFEREVQHG